MSHPMSHIQHFIAEKLGTRTAVYLDTNAWSRLSRCTELCTPVADWCSSTNSYIWLSRFQLSELSRDTRLHPGIIEAVMQICPTFIDRGTNEFDGTTWHQTKRELTLRMSLSDAATRSAFGQMLLDLHKSDSHDDLRKDADNFAEMIEIAKSAEESKHRNWKDFRPSLAKWIEQQVTRSGRQVHPDGNQDPSRYIGLKLSYALAYWRYIVNGQVWTGLNDYLDYLHVADMAYSKVVVTEKNLREGLAQIRRKTDLCIPENVHIVQWLDHPT